jgi:hypothetical protein
MLEKLNQLTSLPELRPRRFPILPVLDTQELLDYMPPGTWEIPEPYTTFETIQPTDLNLMRKYKKEAFRANTVELIGEWINYLNRAETGLQIVDRTIREGVVRCDLESIEAFIHFATYAPKQEEEENPDVAGLIASVRKAFLYLLTDEETAKLGQQRPATVGHEDVDITKFLVNRLAGRA